MKRDIRSRHCETADFCTRFSRHDVGKPCTRSQGCRRRKTCSRVHGGQPSRGSGFFTFMECEGEQHHWLIRNAHELSVGHAQKVWRNARLLLEAVADVLVAVWHSLFGICCNFVTAAMKIAAISAKQPYMYSLSFSEQASGSPPSLLRRVCVLAAFNLGINIGPVLRFQRDGLSHQAAGILWLLNLTKQLVKEQPALPSLETMRAPVLGIITEHVLIECASDIRVVQEHRTSGNAVWMWSQSAVGDRLHTQQLNIVLVHGGGFISGDFHGYRAYCYHLSCELKARILFPQYRLAPESSIDDAVDDVKEAMSLLTQKGQQVIVVGDSAGGTLSLLALQRMKAEGACLPKAAVLMSPLADLTCSNLGTRHDAAMDYMLDAGLLEAGFSIALNGSPPNCPSVSPLHGSLDGLPPMMVSVAANEVLYGDSMALCQAARAAGCEVMEDVVDNMFHVYQLFYPYLPESQHAMERMKAFVRSHAPIKC